MFLLGNKPAYTFRTLTALNYVLLSWTLYRGRYSNYCSFAAQLAKHFDVIEIIVNVYSCPIYLW